MSPISCRPFLHIFYSASLDSTRTQCCFCGTIAAQWVPTSQLRFRDSRGLRLFCVLFLAFNRNAWNQILCTCADDAFILTMPTTTSPYSFTRDLVIDWVTSMLIHFVTTLRGLFTFCFAALSWVWPNALFFFLRASLLLSNEYVLSFYSYPC